MLRSYASNKEIWLNSKYIIIKNANDKQKANFFWSFRVLYLVKISAYKLKILKKWGIHDVFYKSLLL